MKKLWQMFVDIIGVIVFFALTLTFGWIIIISNKLDRIKN